MRIAVNVVDHGGEKEKNNNNSSSTNRSHQSQQQFEAVKNELMKQWRWANCFVCFLCMGALLIPFGFVSKITPLLQENDGGNANGNITATGRRDSVKTVSFCVFWIPFLIHLIIFYVLSRNKMNIRQNKLGSSILAGLYLLSLFCHFFCFTMVTIVFYYYYYECNIFLHYWTLFWWIVIVTYMAIKAGIHLFAIAPVLCGNVGGKRKSLLLMARILLLGLMALLTNAVCTLAIPLWLSYNNTKLLTALATFNLETLLFEAAFAIGLLLSILINVQLAPKHMEKYIEEKMRAELASEKAQQFDILFH